MKDDVSAPLKSEEIAPSLNDLEPSKGVSVSTDIAYPALQDHFGIDKPTKEITEKLEKIWEFFGDESESIGDLMYKLRTQESRLGSPAIGQSRLNKVYQYVTISQRIKSDEKTRDSLLR
jgi:hypothetical protein